MPSDTDSMEDQTMQNLLIAAGILSVLGILGFMCYLFFRTPRRTEVTSNPAAILAQIAGTPLGLMIAQHPGDLYSRIRSRTMREILIAAGSLEREELVQAAIRGGRNREIAEAYADEIISLLGEELPAAMAHTPNLGGEGNPDYAGPNYSDQGAIVDEMRGLIRYSGTGRGE
jgi:hypothetical protein